jgi:autotransporter-associated beta strand protein
MKTRKFVTLLTSLLFVGSFLQADTIYWNGTGTSWSNVSSWSTSSSATTPNPSAVPSSTDEAIFNITGAVSPQTILLNAIQSISKLNFLADSTLLGGNADQTLIVGTGGIEVADGASSVVIGSKTDGQKVALSLHGSQVWTNASINPLVVNNEINNDATSTLTLKGEGGYILKGGISDGSGVTSLTIDDLATVDIQGSNTYSGITQIYSGTTLALGNDNALGSGVLKTDGGTIIVENSIILANKVRIENDGSTWDASSRWTLTGNGVDPAMAIKQYANPAFNIVGPAPLVVSGIFSLSDTPSSDNNGAVGPKLSSSANLIISGTIQDNNSGNFFDAGNKGIGIKFRGAGANITMSGDNSFAGGTSFSTALIIDTGAGYNTITIGGSGGPGANITPFGSNNVSVSTGGGVYLKALGNDQIMLNGLTIGGSGGNDGAKPFGFDGTNNMTIAGDLYNPADVSFPNLASGTLTFSGNIISTSTRTLTILGPGDTVFSGTSDLTGKAIAKKGSGSLTMSGANNTTTATTLKGGSVILDYSAANANRLTQGTTTAALTLGGVDLQLKGGSYAQALGVGGGTTLAAGKTQISQTDGGTSTIALGNISRILGINNGAVLDVSAGAASTTTASANGILDKGSVTVDGVDWGTGPGVIAAIAAYDSFAVIGTDKNILQTDSASVSAISIGTLKIDTTTSGQSLTLGGLMTIYRAGLLFVGSDDYTITGNKIRGIPDYNQEFIVHQNGSGVLTIESEVDNGSTTSLIKTGPGELVFANVVNTYSGNNFLLDGTLSVSASGCLGSDGYANNIEFNGGTLRATAGFITTRDTVLEANGGTIQVDAGTLEISGVFSGYGNLNKTGVGELLLSGNNTFAGNVTISDGTLKMGSGTALGAAATTSDRSTTPVVVTGTAGLDIAGQDAALGNLTLSGGSLIDSVGSGTLGAYSFNIESGTISATLTNVVVPNVNNLSDSVNLYKTTTGYATISSTSSYTGITFIEGGSLFVNGELTYSAVIVYDNGTLKGDGTIGSSICVEGGTVAPSFSDTASGNLTVGEDFTILNGTFNVVVDSSECGKITMTSADALVSLLDANISVEALPGADFTDLTIVDNQGDNPIEGTFAGLPEGSKFVSNGRSYSITYQGGDGNDVVLEMNAQGTLLIVK